MGLSINNVNIYVIVCILLLNFKYIFESGNLVIGVAIELSYFMGGSRISGEGVLMYKSVGVRFADFISFSQTSHENEIIWSH